MADTDDDTAFGVKKSAVRDRLQRARIARTRRAPLVNEVFRMAMPWRRRVSDSLLSDQILSTDDVADILDSTLADAIDDFASDMMATFTPPEEPWVGMEPTLALKPDERRAIADQIQGAVDWFWEDLSLSSFYDAANECYHDLAAGVMAVVRKDFGPTQPVVYEPVEPANLLLDHGPANSVDGRFVEVVIEKRLWAPNYPTIPLPKKYADAKDTTRFTVTDGVYRIWEQKGYAAYQRVVMVDKEVVWAKMLRGHGSCDIVAARWRSDAQSAYGVGPAWKACAPQRVLNEVTALTLANLGNIVDPIVAYSDDGTANIEEGGLDNGAWVNLGDGFDVKVIEHGGRFDVSYFAQDELRHMIRRALYQDGPEQKGKTPPTAQQWTDQRMETQQRFEVPRGKLFREWTIPIVEAHLYLRAEKHGLMPPIALGRDLIKLKPISGQAKARKFDKVAKAERLLQSAQQFMPQTSQMAIDPVGTLRGMKAMLDDEIVTIRSDEELQQMQQMAAQQMQQQGEQQ